MAWGLWGPPGASGGLWALGGRGPWALGACGGLGNRFFCVVLCFWGAWANLSRFPPSSRLSGPPDPVICRFRKPRGPGPPRRIHKTNLLRGPLGNGLGLGVLALLRNRGVLAGHTRTAYLTWWYGQALIAKRQFQAQLEA